jgi:hypothetical protein
MGVNLCECYPYNLSMKKIRVLLLGAIAVAGIIAGCGGSGTSATATSMKKYEAIMNRVFTTANTSVSMGTFPQPTRSTSGSRISSDLIKQKIASMIKRPNLVTRDSEPPPDDGGGTGGNGGHTGGDWGVGTVYFDDWSRLWVRIDEMQEDNSNALISSFARFKATFWEDQALTKPAGSSESSQNSENGKEIFKYKNVITAGPEKGFLNESTWSLDSGSGDTEMTFAYTDGKGQYEFSGSGRYSGSTGEYSYSNRSKHPDGTVITSSGTYKDGKGSYTMEDSRGYRIQYNFNEDWSGSFRLEGPDSILPAVGTWNSEGKGQVQFSDGTVEDIEFFHTTGFIF